MEMSKGGSLKGRRKMDRGKGEKRGEEGRVEVGKRERREQEGGGESRRHGQKERQKRGRRRKAGGRGGRKVGQESFLRPSSQSCLLELVRSLCATCQGELVNKYLWVGADICKHS